MLRNILFFIWGIIMCFPMGTYGQKRTVYFPFDSLSLVKNPGMGWTLYDDANDSVAVSEKYWDLQNEAALKYASTFYVRWRWSDMEPEEGKYAWIYDENFKDLIKGAIDRNLKLAFRIYISSQDNEYESTPSFVFDAGAKYLIDEGLNGKLRSPYPDDSVFQQKFAAFIKAFAEEFDNPDIVDYVDAYNLGWWGEGDHLVFYDQKKSVETFKWIIDLYGDAFQHVPLIIPVDGQIGHHNELNYAINKQGYSIRRDGYASYWMPKRQHILIKGLFPKCFVVSECCYWQDKTIEEINKIDKIYKWKSWHDYYKQVVEEAVHTHANYLDLREPVETKRWLTEAEEQVLYFMRKGGYRIYPSKISYEVNREKIAVYHSWRNRGAGVIPNNNRRWNYKYKTCFAVGDMYGNIVRFYTADQAEPSLWIGDLEYNYKDEYDLSYLKHGKYSLFVGIRDLTKPLLANSAINLAVNKDVCDFKNGWLKVGEFIVH